MSRRTTKQRRAARRRRERVAAPFWAASWLWDCGVQTVSNQAGWYSGVDCLRPPEGPRS